MAAVLLLGPLQALKVGICRGGVGRYQCHSIEPWESIFRYFLGVLMHGKIQCHIYLATLAILLVSSFTLPLRQEQYCKTRTGMRTKGHGYTTTCETKGRRNKYSMRKSPKMFTNAFGHAGVSLIEDFLCFLRLPYDMCIIRQSIPWGRMFIHSL